MSPEPLPRDQLLVSVHEGTAYVHVRGRGSYKVGTALKSFGQGAMDSACRDIVLDLEDCLGMDSTFMGVLAGLALRLRDRDLGNVCLVNVNATNQDVLDTIGLDRVFKTFERGATPEEYRAVLRRWDDREALAADPETKRETAETMLQAHQDLVKVSPGSLPQFKDVITYLHDDLQNADLDGGTPS